MWSETALDLTAGQKITVLEEVTAASEGRVSFVSQSVDLAQGSIVGAGLDENGELVSGGLLTIEAADLINRGTVRSSGTIEASVTGETTNFGQILSGQTLALLGGGIFRNEAAGTVVAEQEAGMLLSAYSANQYLGYGLFRRSSAVHRSVSNAVGIELFIHSRATYFSTIFLNIFCLTAFKYK